MPWKPIAIGAAAVVLLAGGSAAAVMLTGSGHKHVSRPAPPAPAPKFYVDPHSQALQAAQQARGADRALLMRIADAAQGFWYGDWTPTDQVTEQVSAVVRAANNRNAVPVLVTYDIPVRDCHGYSGGGASSPSAYRTWIDNFAAGIGQHRAVVIVEPDALAQLDCLSPDQQQTRLALLRYAVSRLTTTDATTYLDAGHSGWKQPAEMADRLKHAGVENARGFSLNVSNFDRTSDETAYGHAIETALSRRTPFVIDTSRNGAGPTADNAWCNPPGRALGALPTTQTSDNDIDAFLWIKRPGESDGTCNGGPPAGQFWTDYAIRLSQQVSS